MIVTKEVKGIKAKTPDLQIGDRIFKSVGVLSWHRSSKYRELSPFYLKTDGEEIVPNEGGHIFENYWQGFKVYPTVTKQEIYTHYTKKGDERFLVWKHPFERHLSFEKDEDGVILPAYWKWKEKLWNNEKSVRYPNGFQGRHRCVFVQVNDERLGYIEFRKKVHIREYMRLIRKLDVYKDLLDRYIEGENLVIYEVDVPAEGKKGLYGEVEEKWAIQMYPGTAEGPP